MRGLDADGKRPRGFPIFGLTSFSWPLCCSSASSLRPLRPVPFSRRGRRARAQPHRADGRLPCRLSCPASRPGLAACRCAGVAGGGSSVPALVARTRRPRCVAACAELRRTGPGLGRAGRAPGRRCGRGRCGTLWPTPLLATSPGGSFSRLTASWFRCPGHAVSFRPLSRSGEVRARGLSPFRRRVAVASAAAGENAPEVIRRPQKEGGRAPARRPRAYDARPFPPEAGTGAQQPFSFARRLGSRRTSVPRRREEPASARQEVNGAGLPPTSSSTRSRLRRREQGRLFERPRVLAAKSDGSASWATGEIHPARWSHHEFKPDAASVLQDRRASDDLACLGRESIRIAALAPEPVGNEIPTRCARR